MARPPNGVLRARRGPRAAGVGSRHGAGHGVRLRRAINGVHFAGSPIGQRRQQGGLHRVPKEGVGEGRGERPEGFQLVWWWKGQEWQEWQF